MRSRHAWIVALPLATIAIAGCGGGGDDDETTASAPATTAAPPALTKAELIEQGDAVCAEVNAAIGTVASSAEAGDQVTQVAGLYTGMVDSLKNLGAPDETDGYSEFVTAAEEFATAEDEVKLASERGDEAGVLSAESKAASAFASFQTAAQNYGFEECGEGPSAPPATATPESGETESAEAPEEIEPEAVEPEVEAAPEVAPETGGAGSTGGGTAGGTEGGGGGTTGGDSGGIGPG